MDSDGEDSDGVSRKLKEDEFELPRVIWVPDRLENQDDFLKRSKPHPADESFQAAPCTQTTESSRLLRNPSREPRQHNQSVTSTSSTGTTAFTAGVSSSNPSARRPARRIRSLPSPYTASCSNTSSSRRSTVGGTSSSRTESAPSLTISTGHGDVSDIGAPINDTNLASSGSDSLGSLMTRLGERFSRRNEARRKRAEMQVIIANGRKQRQQGYVEVQQLPKSLSSIRRNQPTTNQLSESYSFRQHVSRTRISDRLVEFDGERPRHPLAKGDANQDPNLNTSVSVSAQKRQKNDPSPYIESGATKSMQKFIVIQQNNVQYTRPSEQMNHRQGFPLKSANTNNLATRAANPANHASPAFRQQASMSSVEPITTDPEPPALAVAEPDNDTGHHHNSDTSFDSLTDMDGLLSGGGEEVEALFRACDGF